jgi:hypothetical protein
MKRVVRHEVYIEVDGNEMERYEIWWYTRYPGENSQREL